MQMAQFNQYDDGNSHTTYFVTIWPQSLRNMGIDPDFSQPQKLADELERYLAGITSMFYGAICYKPQADKGHEAGHHCHVSITLPSAMRFKQAANSLGCAHLELQRGTKKEAIDYIEKIGTHADSTEQILAYFGSKDKAKDNSGKRVNLTSVDIAVNKGLLNASNLSNYILANSTSEKEAKEIEARFIRLISSQVSPWRDVNVIYVEGESGSGKTRGVYDQYKDVFKASVDSKTAFPLDNYMGQDVLVLDELRPGVFKPSELFQLLDGYPLNVNIKGGHMPAMWHTVIISTAYPLSKWYTTNEEDTGTTDIMRKQFLRRIKQHFLAIDQTWIEFPTDIDFCEEKKELNFEAIQQEPDYWGPLSEFMDY